MQVREEFVALGDPIRGQRLAYLDNASTTQKPLSVIRAMDDAQRRGAANVHRGVHRLSELATQVHEDARATVQGFLGAEYPDEVIFTRGTTESLNLVAFSFGSRLVPGDEVVVSAMEHHSNIVPWRMLCDARGAQLRVIPMSDAGELMLDQARASITARTRIVAVTHVSNALGTVNPIRELGGLAHAAGAVLVVDGAQAVPHLRVDVRALGCDFYAFSGHKLYGPTGIGVLYGKRALLATMPPWQGGGDMIDEVTFEHITYAAPPARFEAGTPNLIGVVGLAAAIAWLETTGRDALLQHEARLLTALVERLETLPRVHIVGRPRERTGVVSFTFDGVHPHDVGTLLDGHGVAVRAGHHCTQPLMQRLGLDATVRASLGVYNNDRDLDQLVEGLNRVAKTFT